VRQPGLSAIAELVGEPPTIKRRGRRRSKVADRREDISSENFPPLWREALDDMLLAYNRICAYMAIYIEKVTGAPSVDHMIPRSVEWSLVYEWDNYRLACSLMNSRKNDAIAVLDPFRVKPGWFELELFRFHLISAETLPPQIGRRVDRTITRLRLNDRQCREAREAYAVDYWNGEIPFTRLIRRAPFIAMELRRQGRLVPGDL
jgi:5-methylcytosine-specific restriction endonuclease McrA